jgi:hypothetical protein
VIWFPSIFKLVLDRSEKAIEFMIPTPKLLTVGANSGFKRCGTSRDAAVPPRNVGLEILSG